MHQSIPVLGVCFDIDKLKPLTVGSYGIAGYKVLFSIVNIGDLPRGTLFFDGNTNDTLSGRARVFMVVIQCRDRTALQNIENLLSCSTLFERVCAAPRFREGRDVLQEPMVSSGGIGWFPKQIKDISRYDESYQIKQALKSAKKQEELLAQLAASNPQVGPSSP